MITVTKKVFFTRGTHGRRRICQEPSFARQRRMWQVLKRSRMEEPAA